MPYKIFVLIVSFLTSTAFFSLFAIFYAYEDNFLINHIFSILVLVLLLSVLLSLLHFFLLRFFVKNQLKKIGYYFPELGVLTDDESSVKVLMDRISEISKNKAEEIDFLKEREAYRREFIGNVSHELKTPLFSIQGYLLTLIEGGKEDKNILEKYLDRINKSVDRLTFVLKDLDDITEIEKNFKINLNQVNMIALTQEVFDLLDSKAKQFGVKLIFDQTYPNPVKVLADIKRIEQVMINLIENGIKHAGKTTIQVGFKVNEKETTVFVKDNGKGIDEKDLDRIFERFYRADKSRSRDFGGSGLGLSIVKHILEAHGSKISAKSKLGLGSTFEFTLKNA